jgi:hypothetical protein
MPHAASPQLCRIPDHAESKPQDPGLLGDPGSQGRAHSALSLVIICCLTGGFLAGLLVVPVS